MNEDTTPEQFEILAITSEKAAASMQTITDFLEWSALRMYEINVDECVSILEDFIQSNDHIIKRIKKVKS